MNVPSTTVDNEGEAIINRLVNDALKMDADMIEAACEDSLQGGVCGVLVVRDSWGRVLTARASMTVPYGKIYEIRGPISGRI